MGRIPRRGPGDAVLHLALHQNRRSVVREPVARRPVHRRRGGCWARLDAEGVGYDLATHRASPPGIRIWTGATVERSDVEALLPWLDWAWEQERDAAKAG